jgi:hypothetical protein
MMIPLDVKEPIVPVRSIEINFRKVSFVSVILILILKVLFVTYYIMEKIKKTRVNNEEVKAIPFKRDERPVFGAHLAKECYSNIFLVAHKNSGKTTVIKHLIDKFIGKKKDIELFAYVSTLHNDPAWEHMEQEFDKREVPFIAHDSLVDEETGVNQLKDIMRQLQKGKFDDVDDGPLLEFKETKKKKISKHLYPEKIFIFDDLSSELRGKTMETFLKKHRHYKCKTFISSQGLKDILPSAREQIDIWLLFKDLDENILKEVKKNAGLKIPLDKLTFIYDDATSKPHGFLYIDKNIPLYRDGLNEDYHV